MGIHELNHNINNIERFLSKAAAIPVIGTPFGAVKIVIGTLQAVTALVLGILTIPLQCAQDSSFNDHCWTHVKHGIGNFAAGALEAIPLFGTALLYIRYSKDGNDNAPMEMFILMAQKDKFMPYA